MQRARLTESRGSHVGTADDRGIKTYEEVMSSSDKLFTSNLVKIRHLVFTSVQTLKLLATGFIHLETDDDDDEYSRQRSNCRLETRGRPTAVPIYPHRTV
jgi:hypothetical protein